LRLAVDIVSPDIVERLVQDHRVDPAVNHNYPIRKASKDGNIQVINILLALPSVNPGDVVHFKLTKDNYAIRSAAYNRHSSAIKILLADVRVDPSALLNAALISAVKNVDYYSVLALLDDPRVINEGV
jgi:hypothetical protein